MDALGSVAIQDRGRVMPLDSYARQLAADLTGRQHWSAGRGPEAYSGKNHMELFCDLLFNGQGIVQAQLIGLENKPFKKLVGLDPERGFFSAMEIASSKGINDLLAAYDEKRRANPDVQASRDERRAIELFNSANRIASLAAGEPLAIVPSEPGKAFLTVGVKSCAPGTEKVQAALNAIGAARGGSGSMDDAVASLRSAIESKGQLTQRESRALSLELFYNHHDPWSKTEYLYGLAIVCFGLSRLFWRRAMVTVAVVATALGFFEHLLGIALRIAILERAPVSNTFEALLWMGLVAIVLGAGAQLVNRRGYYLFGGVCVALASVLFAAMVPLTDRTNSLPAVLRSNYWLIIHVLTIVASYGVLAVAAVLGHVYMVRDVLFAKAPGADAQAAPGIVRSSPLIVQLYRAIQIGLLLLTAGTILGGVWAADSWGRFWGWDPKETWALISIVVYFAVLHARYVRWLRDFGLAAASILGFVVIVWTFYGVNYVMATGLHSYGFGSGGEVWVGIWAAAELVFLALCWWRYKAAAKTAPRALGGAVERASLTPATKA